MPLFSGKKVMVRQRARPPWTTTAFGNGEWTATPTRPPTLSAPIASRPRSCASRTVPIAKKERPGQELAHRCTEAKAGREAALTRSKPRTWRYSSVPTCASTVYRNDPAARLAEKQAGYSQWSLFPAASERSALPRARSIRTPHSVASTTLEIQSRTWSCGTKTPDAQNTTRAPATRVTPEMSRARRMNLVNSGQQAVYCRLPTTSWRR